MKKLFIYFSDSGNGDKVAEYLAENGYDIRKVIPRKNLPKAFFFKMLKGGFIASLNKNAKLKDYDGDVNGYDEIAVGSPVWNGRLSCPVNTVLKETDFSDKKLSFILYSGGGTAPKAEERLRKEFPAANIIVLQEPKKYPENLKKLNI